MRYLTISFLRRKAGQIDEVVSLTRRVRNSDLTNCNVILDFSERKIVKCIIEGREHDAVFDKMRDYYAKIYPNLIEQLEREAPMEKDKSKLAAKIAPKK